MARVTTSNSAHSADWPFRELPMSGPHWEAAATQGTLCGWRAQETSGVTGHWSGRKGFPGQPRCFTKTEVTLATEPFP